MKRWLIDLGNTRGKLADARTPTAPQCWTWADADASRQQAACIERIERDDIVYLASVAQASLREDVRSSVVSRGARVVEAVVSEQAVGIRTRYDIARLGADRFLQLIAAREKHPQPMLVVSMGTAMTVDLLDDGGVHHGGWILPRAHRILSTLTTDIPTLVLQGGEDRGFGVRTADAVVGGLAAMQRGLLHEAQRVARERHDCGAMFVFCGGGAETLAREFDAPCYPWLALEGLAVWARWREASAQD